MPSKKGNSSTIFLTRRHCIIFYINFLLRRMDAAHSSKISVFISSNVPAVYDVLAARIWALRSKDQGRQIVGGGWRGNGA
jgi:hypothetical protein